MVSFLMRVMWSLPRPQMLQRLLQKRKHLEAMMLK